ncbi:LysR family transcriptional regulator [Roseibium sp. M-1]
MIVAPALSLDQIQVLLVVVETGSFAAAARKLNRATSAISYAIDTLEEQLGVALFDRGTTRRPRLTAAGEAVVAEARALAHAADTLRARVKGLQEGLEAEVSIVVDEMVCVRVLTELCKAFRENFPTVPLRLRRCSMQGVERLLRSGRSQIGIGGLVHMDNTGLTTHQLDGVNIIPVASPDHPLARPALQKSGAAREHLQIVLTESEEAIDQNAYGVVSGLLWRVGDLTTKRAMLVAGIGWGGMPEPMVRDDLKAGLLYALKLRDFPGGKYPMQIAYRNDAPPGPAGTWMMEQICQRL